MGRARHQSVTTENETARKLTIKIRHSHPNVSRMNDDWRKAKLEDPTLEFRMTFVDWRTEYRKKFYDRRKKRLEELKK